MSCPARFATTRNLDRDTLGPKVAEVAKRLGFDLMPWQREVLDIAFELEAPGVLWYSEVNDFAPRQQGKTTKMLPVAVHRCTKWRRPQNVAYFAQSRNAARKKFIDEFLPIVGGARGVPMTPRLALGSEAMLFGNHSRWGLDAPTKTAGHGDTLDLALIDEGFSHEDDRVEQATGPAQLTRPSPQTWVFSAAGDENSTYLWRKILAGRALVESGVDARTAYFEWSAPEHADPGSEDTWRACMPALGYTVKLERIRQLWDKAQRDGVDGIDLFRRAYLFQWPKVPVLADAAPKWAVIDREAWVGLADRHSQIPDAGRLCWAIEVTADRAWTSLVVHGTRSDGLDHLEVVDHRPGTAWVRGRVQDLVGRWGSMEIALDGTGPAGPLAVPLREAGALVVVGGGVDHSHAAAGLSDAVEARALRHRDDSDLSAALANARWRRVGDRRVLDRGDSVAPVSPLVAAAFALWLSRRPPPAEEFDDGPILQRL